MRSLYLLVLLVGGFLWDDCVQASVIRAVDDVNSSCHLYLLDSNTGSTERLKRSHIEASEDHVHSVRLDLAEVNKVIDMDLKCGSVWNSNTKAVVRNGEETKHILHDVPVTCFLSGHLRSGDGYASFSFCNGVSGIIYTGKKRYIIGGPNNDRSEDVAWNDTDDDFPSLPVTITNGDVVTRYPTDDTQEGEVTTQEHVPRLSQDEYNDVPIEDHEQGIIEDITTTRAPDTTKTSSTTPSTTTSSTTTRATTTIKAPRKATIEMGIYINAGQTKLLKDAGLTSVSQITHWIIKKWNLMRELYRKNNKEGLNIDFTIKHLEIWFKNPAYFVSENKTIGYQFQDFIDIVPDDASDARMMYTDWQNSDNKYGLAKMSTLCESTRKSAIVIPDLHGMGVEVHELGHILDLQHEDAMPSCKDGPEGFMGYTFAFKDCYRPILINFLARRSSQCVYTFSEVKTLVSSYTENKLIQANQTITDILDKWGRKPINLPLQATHYNREITK